MKVKTVKNGIDLNAMGRAISYAERGQKIRIHEKGFELRLVTLVDVLLSDLQGGHGIISARLEIVKRQRY